MFLCTPALIRTITPRLGRVLGPRGLMPAERRGTVTDDGAGFIRRLQGTNEWKGDKAGTIRAPIAKVLPPVYAMHDFEVNASILYRSTSLFRTSSKTSVIS